MLKLPLLIMSEYAWMCLNKQDSEYVSGPTLGYWIIVYVTLFFFGGGQISPLYDPY